MIVFSASTHEFFLNCILDYCIHCHSIIAVHCCFYRFLTQFALTWFTVGFFCKSPSMWILHFKQNRSLPIFIIFLLHLEHLVSDWFCSDRRFRITFFTLAFSSSICSFVPDQSPDSKF